MEAMFTIGQHYEGERGRRRPAEPSWMEKKPHLFDGCVEIDRIQYPIEAIGEGRNRKAFKFIPPGELRFGGTVVATHTVVIKILSVSAPNKKTGPTSQRQVIESEVAAYNQLKNSPILNQLGIRIPVRYADPVNFVDPQNPKNGKFWIDECIPTKITGEGWKGEVAFDELGEGDKKILRMAQRVLTHMAVTGTDAINDFRIRNTMLDAEGVPVIVDISAPEDDEFDVEYNLSRYVLDWSNGNDKMINFLVENFPAAKKEQIISMLKKEHC